MLIYLIPYFPEFRNTCIYVASSSFFSRKNTKIRNESLTKMEYIFWELEGGIELSRVLASLNGGARD